MDIPAFTALVVCIVGLVIYVATDNKVDPKPKQTEIAHVMFWVGLFAFLLRWGGLFTLPR